METEQTQALIEETRERLHQLVDARADEMLRLLSAGEQNSETVPVWENQLSPWPHSFKGTKAMAVVFSDGREVECRTWHAVAEVILKDCNADPLRHECLMALTDRVDGNFRRLLTSDPEGMDKPVCVEDGIYFETKFDTEQLLRILVNKVLKPVGYNYTDVTIRHRARPQIQQAEMTFYEEPDNGMTMEL